MGKNFYEIWKKAGLVIIVIVGIIMLQWTINAEYEKNPDKGMIAATIISSLLGSLVGGGIATIAGLIVVEKTLRGQRDLAIDEAKRVEKVNQLNVAYKVYPVLETVIESLKTISEEYGKAEKIDTRMRDDIEITQGKEYKKKLMNVAFETIKSRYAYFRLLIKKIYLLSIDDITKLRFLERSKRDQILSIKNLVEKQSVSYQFWLLEYEKTERNKDMIIKKLLSTKLSHLIGEEDIFFLEEVLKEIEDFISMN